MNNEPHIRFVPLEEVHFSLIHQWFNNPHVQAFYSLRSWTLEDVAKKLMPHIRHEKQIHGFIIFVNTIPVGYVQYCPVKDHPWEDQELPENIAQEAAGMDLFIGEEKYLGKGLGQEIVLCFLENYIWPYYQYCIVDPDVRNESSIRLFQKCGFIKHKVISTADALKRRVQLQLFIKKKPNGHQTERSQF